MPFNPKSRQLQNAWDDTEDKLWLLTPEEFNTVPDGEVLTSINGRKVTVGQDKIDQDTRFGYIAFGFLESEFE